MRALIRAPIAALVFVVGTITLVPVGTKTLSTGETIESDRASPAVSTHVMSTVIVNGTQSQIEAATGQPIARAGPISSSAISIRNMDPASMVQTIDQVNASGTDPTIANQFVRQENGLPRADQGNISNFADLGHMRSDLYAAKARDGTLRMILRC